MVCVNCNISVISKNTKYCSIICQKDFEYKEYIKRWKIGLKNGMRGKRTKNISAHIVRYLNEKYQNKCSLCGWCKIHPLTNRSPLEIDHIDGNFENNAELNLRLLCPNCHSLTSTHKNHNKGNGRKWRRDVYKKLDMPLV